MNLGLGGFAAAMLLGVAACAADKTDCIADPQQVDEQAIDRLLAEHVASGQAFVDSSVSISAAEISSVRAAGVISDGEVVNDGDSAIRLFGYRSKRRPDLTYLVAREAKDPCWRKISWRIVPFE